MRDGSTARALVVALVASGVGLVAPTAPAEAADPTGSLTVVASSYLEYFGDMHWHDGTVYAFINNDKIRTFAADGSSPEDPTSTIQVPDAWHSDGWWQSDRDAF